MASKTQTIPPSEKQALIVKFRLGDDNLGSSEERENLFKLEDKVMQQIDQSGLGQYDGNEIGGGFFVLYMYGPSASQLWDAVSQAVKDYQPRAGSFAIKRYGKPGAKQDSIELSI